MWGLFRKKKKVSIIEEVGTIEEINAALTAQETDKLQDDLFIAEAAIQSLEEDLTESLLANELGESFLPPVDQAILDRITQYRKELEKAPNGTNVGGGCSYEEDGEVKAVTFTTKEDILKILERAENGEIKLLF